MTTSAIVSFIQEWGWRGGGRGGGTEITPDVEASFFGGEVIEDFLSGEEDTTISPVAADSIEEGLELVANLFHSLFILVVIGG
jgi:hypothetical protein